MGHLSRDARRLVPASLGRLLAEREKEILAEVARFPAPIYQSLAVDLSSGRLRGETLSLLDERSARVEELLRQRLVSQGLVELGAMLRIPADLADPVLSVGPGGYPPGVARSYYAFVERSLDKIPIILEDPVALSLKRRQLGGYWQGILERSRSQSPVILQELYRRGRLVDQRRLDYRNPVFGVASLAYSRAVNGIAATWLAVWREAGGDATRLPSAREVRPGRRVPGPQPNPSEVVRP
jgi:hypothetical protein